MLLLDGQSYNEGDPTISNDTVVTNDQVEQIHVRCDVSKCSAEDKQEHTSSGFVGKSLIKKVNSDQLTENTCHSDSVSQQPARSYRE